MSNFWEVFEAAADRFPDNVAVEVQRQDALERVTYRELRAMAEAVARWLLAQGIGRRDRCAILADNDARWCAVYLGMLRIGAVAVPLDTNYSAAQVQTVLSASGARCWSAARACCRPRGRRCEATPLPLVRMYADPGDPTISVDTMVAAGANRRWRPARRGATTPRSSSTRRARPPTRRASC